MFKIAYGTLQLPLYTLDDLTPMELFLLLENKHEADKEHYEMLSYAMRVAFVSANSGKHIPLFEEEANTQEHTVTREEREATLAFLEEAFEE